jgi:hypothetical protein
MGEIAALLRNLFERMFCVLHRPFHSVLDIRNRPFDLACTFVILALVLEPLVAGQAAHGLLDPTLGLFAEFAHLYPPLDLSETLVRNRPKPGCLKCPDQSYSSFRATDRMQASSGSCIADNAEEYGRLNQDDLLSPSVRRVIAAEDR